MKWCIENCDGKVYEVLNLFDHNGEEISEGVEQAVTCVLADGENYIATVVQGPIHRVQ